MNPSRGLARRDDDEKLEKTEWVGLERPLDRPLCVRPRLKNDGAELREW